MGSERPPTQLTLVKKLIDYNNKYVPGRISWKAVVNAVLNLRVGFLRTLLLGVRK
jgi:hypothetical protein